MKVICSLKIFIIIDLFKSIEEKPKFQGIAFKDKVTKKNKKIPKNNNFQVKNVINFFKEQKEIKKSEKNYTILLKNYGILKNQNTNLKKQIVSIETLNKKKQIEINSLKKTINDFKIDNTSYRQNKDNIREKEDFLEDLNKTKIKIRELQYKNNDFSEKINLVFQKNKEEQILKMQEYEETINSDKLKEINNIKLQLKSFFKNEKMAINKKLREKQEENKRFLKEIILLKESVKSTQEKLKVKEEIIEKLAQKEQDTTKNFLLEKQNFTVLKQEYDLTLQKKQRDIKDLLIHLQNKNEELKQKHLENKKLNKEIKDQRNSLTLALDEKNQINSQLFQIQKALEEKFKEREISNRRNELEKVQLMIDQIRQKESLKAKDLENRIKLAYKNKMEIEMNSFKKMEHKRILENYLNKINRDDQDYVSKGKFKKLSTSIFEDFNFLIESISLKKKLK